MLSNHWLHHSRFYIALALALMAAAIAASMHWPVPAAIGGDVFFSVYLAGSFLLALRISKAELDQRADVGDEGMIVIFVLTLAAIVFACVVVFVALNQHEKLRSAPLVITLIGAPLGWFMLHAVMAFHYANIFYSGNGKKALLFPGEEPPGVLDFMYYSFVIGMTTQVSDVQVLTTRMRRATLIHSVVSFFFNAVLIAMAVNAVIARAG